MKNIFKNALLLCLLLLLLAACGSSPEKKFIGAWKMYADDEVQGYMEVAENAIVFRDLHDDEPMPANYRLTNSSKDAILLEVAEPGTDTYEFLFEGKFKGKNEIEVVSIDSDDQPKMHLQRVKDVQEDLAHEKKRQAQLEEKEEKNREKQEAKENTEREKAEEKERLLAEKEEKKREEEEKQAEKEAREQEIKEERERAKEREKQEEAAEKERKEAESNSIKAKYQGKAAEIERLTDIETANYDQDTLESFGGVYGQFYSNWDDLLNELWADLKKTMPSNEFNKLLQNQRQWIKDKEAGFAEYGDASASSRRLAMDYLATTTKQRVYYLIENYAK